MTIRDRARRAVMEWLRPYVERGDSDAQLRAGSMGRYSNELCAGIAGGGMWIGWGTDDARLVPLRSGQIGVSHVDGEECCEVFSLSEITSALRGTRAVQEALL